MLLAISRGFPTTFRRFPKIYWKVFLRPHESFQKVSKIIEDSRRLPKTPEKDPKTFRSYTNKFKYSWRVKNVTKIDITRVDKNNFRTCGIAVLSICSHSCWVRRWVPVNLLINYDSPCGPGLWPEMRGLNQSRIMQQIVWLSNCKWLISALSLTSSYLNEHWHKQVDVLYLWDWSHYVKLNKESSVFVKTNQRISKFFWWKEK